MTKTELNRKLSTRLAEMPGFEQLSIARRDAIIRELMAAIKTEIVDTLSAGEEIEVGDVMMAKPKDVEAKTVTVFGAEKEVKAHTRPVFTPKAGLKKEIKERTTHE